MKNILWQGNHWNLILVSEYTLPGYLILGARDESLDQFSELSDEQSVEMGRAISLACSVLERCLKPKNILAGRYGLMPGHQIHYHIVPIYDWVFEAFENNEDYKVFETITPPDYPANPDGAALLAFVWRELCVKKIEYIKCNPEGIFKQLRSEITKRAI